MNCKGDEDIDAKRSRPSIGKPASGHARKERVLLIGTDQRITSGPAATMAAFRGRIHDCTRTLRTTVRFPLHRGRRPYMTRTGPRPGRNPAAQQAPAITEVCYPFSRKHGRHWAVKRREFITVLGSAAVWPASAQAQPAKVARVGFLGLVSPSSHASRVAAFRAGLRDLGWIEGRNLLIEFRWAEGNYD